MGRTENNPDKPGMFILFNWFLIIQIRNFFKFVSLICCLGNMYFKRARDFLNLSSVGGLVIKHILPVLLLLPLILFLITYVMDWLKPAVVDFSVVGITLLSCSYVFFIAVKLSTKERKKNEEIEMRLRNHNTELIKLNDALNAEIRERAKAEMAVGLEKQKFDDVLELLPAYIILLTRDYKVPYANRYFRERFGESNGKCCYEYLFNRTEPCEVCETFRTLRENRPVTWEWTGPDNNIYSIFDFPFRDSDNSPMIMEMGIDITGLKNAQAEMIRLNTGLERRVDERTRQLTRTNEKLLILSETASKLLETTNPQEVIDQLCNKVMKYLDCEVFFNYLSDDRKCRLFLNSYAGIPAETASKIKWLDKGGSICGCVASTGTRIISEDVLNNGDERASLVRSFGIQAYACHPLLSGDNVLGTLSFGTSKRTTFTAEEISVMKAVADQVAIAMTRMRDEQAVRRSEEKIRSYSEKLNLALQNGNIGTWELYHGSNTMHWDERMENIFGFLPGTFNGTYSSFEKCLADEDIPHLRKSINDAVERNVPFDTVYRIRKNGEFSYISSKALVVRNNEGEPLMISGVCFDITDMKKGAEKALFKLNEDLIRSNRELEQFARVASHDLQEPLRMVSSYTQLLAMRYRDKLDDDANEFIRYAVGGAARMQSLINDLLNFSRIEARSGEIRHINLNDAFRHAVNNLRISIDEKKASVTRDELPEIPGHEGQMIQLFQNLLGNALKFSDKRPVIHVSSVTENGHYRISVRDNGIGIEPQYYDRIFKIFQRLMPRDQYEGNGIGLAICKKIVEHHGGTIRVESEPGLGSEFIFSIPRS